MYVIIHIGNRDNGYAQITGIRYVPQKSYSIISILIFICLPVFKVESYCHIYAKCIKSRNNIIKHKHGMNGASNIIHNIHGKNVIFSLLVVWNRLPRRHQVKDNGEMYLLTYR
uniref:Uncharacterized protein n=1 Tax=Cacopsylla melanoneura TaxID=428564 RepID=A0A8D8XGR2_9HEMI